MFASLNVMNELLGAYQNPTITTSKILAVLIAVCVISAYEFFVYRFVSHRAFYNKSFNTALAIIPFFIATIILCLQSNIVITLGTIGALAIIRFRTAVKDPVDMIYILWSIHTGITCGCQLYEVAILTSVVVTIVLLVIENVQFTKKPFVLIVNCDSEKENTVLETLKAQGGKYKVKSRNYTPKGMDLVVEMTVKDPSSLASALKAENIEKFSIIEYDSDDIL